MTSELCWRISCRGAVDGHAIGAHGPGDVFKVLFAEIDEAGFDSPTHVLIDGAGYQHPAGFADSLQTRRDIDPLAKDVVAFDQHVAEMNADAIDDALALRRFGVSLDHQSLDCGRAFHRVDHGRKLQQQPVAHRLDDTPAPVRHERSRRVPMLPNDPRCPCLILPHEAGIADDVDGHDRGELACFGHWVPQAVLAQ